MTYDDLSRFELEDKVWSQIVGRITIKALLKPHLYRLIEDLNDENMKLLGKEALSEAAERHGEELAHAIFNYMEQQGFLRWGEEGRPIVGMTLTFAN